MRQTRRAPSRAHTNSASSDRDALPAAAQTTVAGVETDSSANYPHVYWHGGAAGLLSRLYDGYRHTLDIEWLKKIYPLMVEAAGIASASGSSGVSESGEKPAAVPK